MNEMYTTQEVADFLRVHVGTVRRWIEEGKIETVKFGKRHLIKKEELQKVIESNKKENNGA